MSRFFQSFAAITSIPTGAIMLALATAAPAQTDAHEIQTVIDGARPLGPLHGQAQGTWIEPGVQEGRLYAKLFDSQGVERFTLDASVIQYMFLVAAPVQGEIHGQLIVPHVAAGRGMSFALTQIYAMVEGTWIETTNGRGAFTASILRANDEPDRPPVQIGLIEGTFQIISSLPAGRLQLSAPESSIVAKDASAGRAANGMRDVQPVPLEVLPGSVLPPAHGLQLVGDGTRGRALNNHGGLGQVGPGGPSGSGTGATVAQKAATGTPIGRLALRWQLFE